MTHPVNPPPPGPRRVFPLAASRPYLVAFAVVLLPLGVALILTGVVGPAPDTGRDAGYVLRPATEVERERHQMNRLHADLDAHPNGVKP